MVAKWTEEKRARASAKWTPEMRKAASERWALMRGKSPTRGWTPEARLSLSVIAKQRWDETPLEIRRDRMMRGRETHFLKFPERRAGHAWLNRQIEDGLITPDNCVVCGGAAYAYFDWQSPCWTFLGWRCRNCRKSA